MDLRLMVIVGHLLLNCTYPASADCIDLVDFVACPSWSLSDDITLLTAAKMIATSAKDATLKLSKIRVGVLDFKFIDGVTSHVWCMCAAQSIYTLWFNTCITRSTNTTVTYCTTVSTTVNCRTSKCDWKVQVRDSGTSTVVIFYVPTVVLVRSTMYCITYKYCTCGPWIGKFVTRKCRKNVILYQLEQSPMCLPRSATGLVL